MSETDYMRLNKSVETHFDPLDFKNQTRKRAKIDAVDGRIYDVMMNVNNTKLEASKPKCEAIEKTVKKIELPKEENNIEPTVTGQKQPSLQETLDAFEKEFEEERTKGNPNHERLTQLLFNIILCHSGIFYRLTAAEKERAFDYFKQHLAKVKDISRDWKNFALQIATGLASMGGGFAGISQEAIMRSIAAGVNGVAQGLGAIKDIPAGLNAADSRIHESLSGQEQRNHETHQTAGQTARNQQVEAVRRQAESDKRKSEATQAMLA